LSPDSDGVYRLRYKMELKNDSAVDIASTSYDCQLYVDMDVDGRYEDNEILTGLSITDGSGNGQSVDSNGKFHLKAGNTYYITREIPEGYTGFLSWKLSFNQNERTYSGADSSSVIRSAITGFSAVPASGIKPTIKVLQITNFGGQTNLDLAGEDMRVLYSNVSDFSIDVTKISSEDYIGKKTFAEKTHREFLNDYDMVVLGFADLYVFGWEAQDRLYPDEVITKATLAIRSYALSGRSIMFTHDLNSSMIEVDSPTHWGYYANKYLRDVQGMDRFGEIKNSGVIPQDAEYQYNSLYDEAKVDGHDAAETTALVNSVILTSEHKAGITRNVYGETARKASWEYSYFWNYRDHANGYNDSHVFNSWVEQVNAGQITEYPYKISEVFEVTQSHPQYFQLNLDTDSRDENTNDDIVVWYTLGEIPGWPDSYYKGVEKDVRNNYFIYNKGNVTYTGSGDRMISSDMEKKLFVNTLVASYRTGTHAARTFFKENEWETSPTITGMYLPYDPAMNSGAGGFLQDMLAVNFKVSNMDLRKSNEPLHVKYYIDGTDSDYTIKLDGKPYKEITPLGAYRLTAKDGSIVKSQADNVSILQNNSMYQLQLTYESLGLMASEESIRNKHTTNIYVRLGYEEMASTGDLTLPASESMSGLNIVCTQLFELK